MVGKLYLCATPIGNLEDITLRVLRVLKEVDIIAAEDTRHTMKLLNHFEINTPMTSYHEHNKMTKTESLIHHLRNGKTIAQVSDAGTPGISDPGEELARAAYEAGIEVTSLPGATALITAVVLSGMSTRRFSYEGFLPTNKKERRAVLEDLKAATKPTVFYEAPHRLKKTLQELCNTTDSKRSISICRELTKKHETINRFSLEEAMEYYKINEPRGEYVLVLEGMLRKDREEEERKKWLDMKIEDHMEIYRKQNISKKEAMKMVAKDRGVSKRDIYNHLY